MALCCEDFPMALHHVAQLVDVENPITIRVSLANHLLTVQAYRYASNQFLCFRAVLALRREKKVEERDGGARV